QADPTGTIRAAVAEVIDGDTIILEQSGIPLRVDLESIDAPELNQAYGEESKAFLANLIEGKKVTIQQVKTVEYRHITGFVKLENLEVNRKMISSGMAWYDLRNGYDALLKDTQKEAKNAKIGLWSDKKAISPWDYRNGPKEAFKLPTFAVSYDSGSTGGNPLDGVMGGPPEGANNAALDNIMGSKVPAFVPPPPPPPGANQPAVNSPATQRGAAPTKAPNAPRTTTAPAPASKQ
ncbi:MAG: thermonuclease family protein, partial [Hafnia sp.]